MSLPGRHLAFGPFALFPAARLLTREGRAVPLGGRALDILMALTERAGEVVAKQELIARVWPDVAVDEGSLRVHMAALRKALGDGQPGARYVTNIPGRGYCFVAPLARHGPDAQGQQTPMAHAVASLPPRLIRMVGRDQPVQHIIDQLGEHRFVSIVGPGGIGKTTVAVAIGHALLDHFAGAVRYLDLAPIEDPALVPGALACLLGLPVHSDTLVPGIIGYLRDKRTLIIFDNCEHLIALIATLAEQIIRAAPQTSILSTSREALRAEGEIVHRLIALQCPPPGHDHALDAIAAYPAVQLFIERAAANGDHLSLDDRDAPYIAEICRKLDGIALAIELAAGRVNAYGIEGIAGRLNDRLQLLWRGRRTAPHRHQTLQAALDWSYDLVSGLERTVLHRLSGFVGSFTLEAAQATASDDDLRDYEIAEAVAGLVDKSLVSAEMAGRTTLYRLLDTTRSYVTAKAQAAGEANDIFRRHALYYLGRLSMAPPDESAAFIALRPVPIAQQAANIRAALEWSFSADGDTGIGTQLAAAAAPFLLGNSLLTECRSWTTTALTRLAGAASASHCEMELQTSLGLSLMFLQGNSPAARAALSRGLALAETLGEAYHEMRLLQALHIFLTGNCELRDALPVAQRAEAVARKMGDPAAAAMAATMLAATYSLLGDQRAAEQYRAAGLLRHPHSHRVNIVQFAFSNQILAVCTSCNILWLRGAVDQALQAATQTIAEAEAFGHPATLCICLIWTAQAIFWAGDWARLDRNIDLLLAVAGKHALTPYRAIGIGLRGQVLVRQGRVREGVALLEDSFEVLKTDPYQILKAVFLTILAEGYALLGERERGLAMVDDAFRDMDATQGVFYTPEALRIKGDILAMLEGPHSVPAEDWLNRAQALSETQTALVWQLRAAISLAKLYAARGEPARACDVLRAVIPRFTEGFDAPDFCIANQLLRQLSCALTG